MNHWFKCYFKTKEICCHAELRNRELVHTNPDIQQQRMDCGCLKVGLDYFDDKFSDDSKHF